MVPRSLEVGAAVDIGTLRRVAGPEQLSVDLAVFAEGGGGMGRRARAGGPLRPPSAPKLDWGLRVERVDEIELAVGKLAARSWRSNSTRSSNPSSVALGAAEVERPPRLQIPRDVLEDPVGPPPLRLASAWRRSVPRIPSSPLRPAALPDSRPLGAHRSFMATAAARGIAPVSSPTIAAAATDPDITALATEGIGRARSPAA